jgi:hypothetical protein
MDRFTDPLTGLSRFRRLLLSIALVLAACAEDSDTTSLPDLQTTPLESSLSTLVEGIGDAENATFTADGRLFVTGGENIYEITKQEERYVARALYTGVCNFTGVVVRAGYLYTTCTEGSNLANLTPYLLAAPVSEHMELAIIHQFEHVMIPNGIAFDERGRLFVTDFTPLAGKVVALSFQPASPLEVVRESVWHEGGHPLANGLKIFRNKVYMTDLNQIKVIPIEPDGSAGRLSVLASRIAVLDDLYVSDQGIVVGDFYGGQLVYYSLSGKLLKQTAALFRSPSSITPGRPPLVPDGALVVTEKGALGELTSSDGNRVSLYSPLARAAAGLDRP